MSTENESSSRADFVLHGHFYQPPRENPWTDEVDREPSASPFHDWNERIQSECYASNAAARIHDEKGRVLEIVNNYESISFNFGPTLLRWMERKDPHTLQRIVEADRESADRTGHGNALAQTYNHMILPLADARDLRTQILWGRAEFAHRFGREAEALWLAETAANHAVLDECIVQGLRFVILAPHQAGEWREPGGEWRRLRGQEIDPSRPYLYRHSAGNGSLVVFFYDGPLAQRLSFGDALKHAANFGRAVEAATPASDSRRPLVHAAVDGETAGHHVAFGNLALAWATRRELPARGLRVTNYAAFLDQVEVTHEVRLHEGPRGEGTSWSCAHGVGRWIRDCRCRIDPHVESQQKWRGVLREALDQLRDGARRLYEHHMTEFVANPWAVRDASVRLLLDDTPRGRRDFVLEHARRPLDDAEVVRMLTLLEMQHQAMLMYTSCGWFFDDIAGLEAVQILRYAARLLDHWRELESEAPEEHFVGLLAAAKSNDPERGSGADIYRGDVLRARVTPERIAAHLAMTSLLEAPAIAGRFALHAFVRHEFLVEDRDGAKLVCARFELEHQRTLRRFDLHAIVLHRGALDLITIVLPHGEGTGEVSLQIRSAFLEGGPERAERWLADHGSSRRFGVEDLLEEGRQALLEGLFHDVIDRFGEAYSRLYSEHRELLSDLHSKGMELPEELQAATQFTLRKRFEREFLRHADATDPGEHAKAVEVVREAMRQNVRLDSQIARRRLESMLVGHLRDLGEAVAAEGCEAGEAMFRRIEDLLRLADEMRIRLDLEPAQLAFHEAFRARRGAPVEDCFGQLEALAVRLGFAPRS